MTTLYPAGVPSSLMRSSSDDEIDEALLITLETALGGVLRTSSAPTPEQLEFKHSAAKELKERVITYNLSDCGWCLGRIRRPSADKNKSL